MPCNKHFPHRMHGVEVHSVREKLLLTAAMRPFCSECAEALIKLQQKFDGALVSFLAREGIPIWRPPDTEPPEPEAVEVEM